MKRSLPSILVIGLIAALLVSCGPSATVQQTVATPTASSHAHMGRIAWKGFLDHDQTTAAIFSANSDGSDVHQLTPNTGEEYQHPDWSADGSKIIFTQNGTGDILMMNADGTGLRVINGCTKSCLGLDKAAWSPDGSQIAYDVGIGPQRPNGDPSVGAIWIMQADGSHPVQLTKPPLPTSFADTGAAWSPDGKRLVFMRNHLVGQSYDDQALFVINRDGTGLKQVTALGRLKAGNAHWSPDGTRILFQSFASFDISPPPQLYTIFPDGTHLVQLTTKERNSWPAWSPDGTKIIFVHRSTTEVDQNAHLYEMNADGSGLVQITRNDFWQTQPAWGTAP